MAEIVPAEPIEGIYFEQGETSASASERPRVTLAITDGISDNSNSSSRRRDNNKAQYVAEPFDSERLPTVFASEIQRFLRVANLLGKEEPRVAYLCRVHAFVIAHNLDKNSSGRGVRQFKTSLLHRLEQDEHVTKKKGTSDIRELKNVYRAYRDYFTGHDKAFDLEQSRREKLINARNIASVLFEVLKTVTDTTNTQALIEGNAIHKKTEFNILPLEQGGIQHAIMQQPEIKAAIAVLRNVRGLPPAQEFKKHGAFVDLFDFLQHCFGFQEANVANQREHLILLLANMQTRQTPNQISVSKLGEGGVDELMRKFFKNYTNWCKFLGRKSNIRLPFVKQEAQQYKILYIGLYLLIWGEAANLRFMPECLCYILHHMAYELHGILSGAISLTTWEKVMPAYGGEPESFLNKVVTPIYNVIKKEVKNSKGGTADHCIWRNYDDLNEYFWSPDCFKIGWPMRTDHHDFFYVKELDNEDESKPGDKKAPVKSPGKTKEKKKKEKKEKKDEENPEPEDDGDGNHERQWLGKTNFVEIRSFWQIFRSFDRMWSFFILSLQAIIIIACHDLGSPLQLFDAVVFEDIISIFITSAILKLIQAILDIAFVWKARYTMEYSQKVKLVMKLVFASIWTIVLPVCYANSRRKYTCYSLVEEWCFTSYMVAAAIYLTTNAVEVVLFFVPAVAKYIEVSNYQICKVLSWWTQPRIYVGRGMQEDQVSVLKYTLFWILVLSCKFVFSYSFEIKPLIAPTRQIMKIGVKYDWHELFPKVKSNAGAIMAVWSPVVIVYFMDTQIWYSVFCTIIGGLYGILHHLGEIRTLGMLRSRFDSLPSAFNVCLVPPSSKRGKKKRKGLLSNIFQKMPDEKNGIAKFVVVWNQIVNHLRLEDLISNREMDLMMMPVSSELFSGKVRWPIFLLANKFSTALTIAKDFKGKDEVLAKKITKDKYMFYAVRECYQSLKYVLEILIVGSMEKRIICDILSEIEKSIQESTLLKNFNLKVLPALHVKVIELAELLVEGDKDHQYKVVKALLDILELVTNDMMVDCRILDMFHFPEQNECGFVYFRNDDQLFANEEMNRDFYPFSNENSIHFPLPENGPLMEKIKRFLLLLTVKDTAMDVPANIDARRRVSFFATSLFTDMPDAPKVHNMLPFSVITPHYIEDINFSLKELGSEKEEDSIIFYMQKIYPDEWKNFLERMGCDNRQSIEDEQKTEDLRLWASFRGQTLSRTVRGMMYYRESLKLQAFLDMAEDEDILEGYETAERGNRALFARLEALADMKYTYVISCQSFASQKASNHPHYQDIIDLMIRYPSLRVAYVEEKEEIAQGRSHNKVYSSKLVKVVNGFEQTIYQIKLPGPPHLGEGKPENQNNAIIFTRGEALQTIDMNQDNYLEEALKMRNLLQEFLQRQGRRPPTILGLREHIFTGSVSSLAWFMSYQETSFVTIGQRLLANPLRVRFHYGHPDVFDRVFHITRGGVSKASKTINLSEDVFAGFNTTLRRGGISYHEYLQIGKGRDVALNQISKFEAKVANGNSEQTISRDIFRLGRQFDFFRMLSCYFTTIGFYFSSLISVIGIYVFLYGQLYLVLSGLERALIIEARIKNVQSLETALASQSFIQLGLLTGLPMAMEIGLEKGFLTALKDFVLMQLQLAAVFFTFSLGTKTHYYGRTVLHGGAKYRPTGRKVVFHASFTENYRLYSRSHFVKAFELMLLLIVYNMFRRSYQSNMTYVLITYAIWFMSLTWLCAPFLFNPAGFSWTKTVDDWKEWNKWIREQGGIGIHQDKSWHSWWHDEQAHLRQTGLASRMTEILLSLRFFIYQYGLVYHLDISQHSKNFLVYVLSWIVIVAIFLLVKAVNMGRKLLSANYQLGFRFFKAFLFIAVISVIITLSVICELSLTDLFICCLAFMPTAWGLIQIAQASRPKIQHTGLWDFTRALAREFDYGMGIFLFAPIAILAWLPIIKAFHARILFNEAFKRHLQIQPILAGKKKKHRT
ncbi:hypothetical protein RJT34_29359 [Clitoria ternatea]|uniref:1,3-beta-glucan synthase n=1 Tax=Clitoria ternatea TaxID=43366 RepID=A0AAN9FG50_CLITE